MRKKVDIQSIALDDAGRVVLQDADLEALSALAGGSSDDPFEISAVNGNKKCKGSTNDLFCTNTGDCSDATNTGRCTNSSLCFS